MKPCRKPYPSDVSDEEWALVAPCFTLLPEKAGPRRPGQRGSRRGRQAGPGEPRESQSVPEGSLEIAWVDQGCTGERAREAAARHGLALEIVKLPEARRGFVLLPRRWGVERSFAWATRFRRLVKNCERYPQTLAGLHTLAFATLRLAQLLKIAPAEP